jgi:predicted DNA binding CopG/RHH family protein
MPDRKTIPHFSSDEEAAEFWDTHSVTDYLDELAPTPDVRFRLQNLKQISLRLAPGQIATLKVIAAGKGIGYQTMLRMWITERMQQEKSARV